MSQGFGREMPAPHTQASRREATKYLVVIPAAEGPIAKLFLGSREFVTELDANTEEVTTMTKGLTPAMGAAGPEWDRSMAGHNSHERAAAAVYTLLV